MPKLLRLIPLLFLFQTSLALANPVLVSSANIYTVDTAKPKVEAFVVNNDEIVAVGSKAELLAKYEQATQLDLGDATVVPGIIDAHVHLLSLGQALNRVDLVDSVSKADILERLKEFDKTLPPGQWMLGRGWDQNDWPVKELPSAADLDEEFPDRPIWLGRIDGHAAWANTAAMKFVKKDLSGSWQPEGGEILRNKAGQATGVFIDNATQFVAAQIPSPSAAEMRADLVKAMDKTASVGLTSVHNAGTSKDVWEVLKAMHKDGDLRIRYYAMADGSNAMLDHLCEQGATIDPDAMLTARAVKLYSDGALGSRGAALLAPYSDKPDQSGLLLETPEVLKQYAERAARCGLQVNIHAIGDRGNRVTLDALEAAGKYENPGRHRIEHSQVVAPEDFKRFKDLQLIASVQPTHATSDMYWAEDRVGDERIKGAYAWQTFIENGIPLALGSDFPVERAAPLLGFHAAVARQDAKNWPQDGWYAEQSLTREQALYGFTLGAAYAGFQEDQIGSIEVGKKADFVVLSQDIMQVPAEQILDTKIIATYLNGEAIYQAAEQ